MAYLLQQLMNAVPISALYATLSFGYALAFGMMRRPDITYGALFAFAGQVFLLFAHIGWNRLFLILPATLALAAVASFLYTTIAGWSIVRHVLRPLHVASANAVIVASLALVILLSEIMRLSMNSRELWLSPFLNARVIFWRGDGSDVGLTVIQIGSTVLMAGLVAVGHLLLVRTRAGRAWRAVADDPRAARLCGVNADGVCVLSYVAAASIAAICGILATSYYGSMDFASGLLFGLKVVLIAAVGGYSVPLKSAAGAAVVGLSETLWSGYAPILWRDAAIISALVLLLVASRRERVIP
ncbi:branched-chain amino acid ABC transporter permease [Rhizobium sp. S95]|uniref:Branched-chain amino acid ABC transporter permease n=1 Tax=Ciceribacter sichuanensis TaxID=2949647 RepID=A0AAJ1BT55_9HYPH|nr:MULTISPECIES: branched-chain amino acid ABC transporter permease [unclassified Ciceribacter]MCM2395480.1 branched-chain amino acid ABC transporter permease [Ciceribacter sp. S95]MCO5955902.1 branched-chain amino acid ABC transporter permease [Ciceribacter sp. S101]